MSQHETFEVLVLQVYLKIKNTVTEIKVEKKRAKQTTVILLLLIYNYIFTKGFYNVRTNFKLALWDMPNYGPRQQIQSCPTSKEHYYKENI